MGLIKEPKYVDFTVKSKPWTADELADFRKLMNTIKAKNNKKKLRTKTTVSKKKVLA
jgi:hypothetical protein